MITHFIRNFDEQDLHPYVQPDLFTLTIIVYREYWSNEYVPEQKIQLCDEDIVSTMVDDFLQNGLYVEVLNNHTLKHWFFRPQDLEDPQHLIVDKVDNLRYY